MEVGAGSGRDPALTPRPLSRLLSVAGEGEIWFGRAEALDALAETFEGVGEVAFDLVGPNAVKAKPGCFEFELACEVGRLSIGIEVDGAIYFDCEA